MEFSRRLDDYGSDPYFSHVTIDWFNSYRDYYFQVWVIYLIMMTVNGINLEI